MKTVIFCIALKRAFIVTSSVALSVAPRLPTSLKFNFLYISATAEV
ncbi:MAG: hypothetical protein IJW64_06480 [Clostridia bacterium]|nr:hypothetical protein [Clostridia bacterium]